MIPPEVLAAIVAAIEAEEGGPVRLVRVEGAPPAGWPAPWAWAGRQEQMAARAALLARPRGTAGAGDRLPAAGNGTVAETAAEQAGRPERGGERA